MTCVSNSARVARFMEMVEWKRRARTQNFSSKLFPFWESLRPVRVYVAGARHTHLCTKPSRGQRGRALAAHEQWARPRGCCRPSAVWFSAGG